VAGPLSTPFWDSLGALLASVAQAPTKARSGPGRPPKIHAAVRPVLLHLYEDHVRWLDQYADFLAGLTPGNRRLGRVEIVRALLLALAEHALRQRLELPEGVVIWSEQDLQRALVAALEALAQAKRPGPMEAKS
jgi:hypothetical protein